MSTSRRTFLKSSAMLAATGLVSRGWLAAGVAPEKPSSHPISEHSFFTKAKHFPEVIAHRGGNGQWPGETMMAYKGAANIGTDILEMDVYVTKDDELALMHDQNVKSTTEGHGLIHTLTLAELQELNAGYRWSDGANHHPYQKVLGQLPESLRQDLRVPSLKQVFAAFPEMRMVVEMKPAQRSPAAALCKLIRERGMQDKVLVASFSSGYMQQFREVCGEVATSTSLSLKDLKTFLTGKSLVNEQAAQPAAIQAPHQLITEGLVKKAKARGLRLHAWTVNNSDDMRRMQALGVDGIITDYPGPLMALLGRVGAIA